MSKSVELFNSLNGKTVSRKEIEEIIIVAKQENQATIIYRLSNLLNTYPEAETFELEIEEFDTSFLAAPRHKGSYKDALDNCGRLKKGWKFENGNVVKVASKEAKPKTTKKSNTEKTNLPKQVKSKITPKKTVEEKKHLRIRKNSSEYKKVLEFMVFKMYSLDNNFSGEKIKKGLPDVDKKLAKITKFGDIYTIDIHSNLWYTTEEKLQPKKKVENAQVSKKSIHQTSTLSHKSKKNVKPTSRTKKEKLYENGQYGLFGTAKEKKLTLNKIMYHASIESPISSIKENTIINELGIHLGTKKTAQQILTKLSKKNAVIRSFKVTLNNAIEIHDFFRWEAFVVSRKLALLNIISESERKRVLKKPGNKKDAELVKLLKTKGYDGFIYENAFEGGGKSCIVFDKNQIEEIKEIKKSVRIKKTNNSKLSNPLVEDLPVERIIIVGNNESVAKSIAVESAKSSVSQVPINIPTQEQEVKKQKALPEPIPVLEQPKIKKNSNPLIKSMAERKARRNESGNEIEHFNISGPLADFFGKIEIKPVESVAITLDAPQGAGKTRLLFQIQEMFANGGYKGLFLSLEEHPDSELILKKQDQYISPQNEHLIDTMGELPNTYEELVKLMDLYDSIYIDSWGKLLKKFPKLNFDYDLRKKLNGKAFVVIFQRTQDGKMRGGSDTAFDGDIITKIEKDVEDYRNNYAFFDKNRYQDRPSHELKFNIYNGELIEDIDFENIPVQTISI